MKRWWPTDSHPNAQTHNPSTMDADVAHQLIKHSDPARWTAARTSFRGRATQEVLTSEWQTKSTRIQLEWPLALISAADPADRPAGGLRPGAPAGSCTRHNGVHRGPGSDYRRGGQHAQLGSNRSGYRAAGRGRGRCERQSHRLS